METSLQTLLARLAPDDAALLIESLGETVFRTVSVSIMEVLPDEVMPEFEQKAAEGPEALEAFLREHIPNLEEFIDQSLEGLRADLKDFLDASS